MNQTATYWPVTGHDIFGGNSFGAPQEIAVRWEDVAQTIRNKSGGEYVTKSRVFSNTNFNLDGYLYLGESVAADPRTVSGASEIQQVSKIPDLGNLETLYTAFL